MISASLDVDRREISRSEHVLSDCSCHSLWSLYILREHSSDQWVDSSFVNKNIRVEGSFLEWKCSEGDVAEGSVKALVELLDHSVTESESGRRELVGDSGVDIGIVSTVVSNYGSKRSTEHLWQPFPIDDCLNLSSDDLPSFLVEAFTVPVRVETFECCDKTVVLFCENCVPSRESDEQIDTAVSGSEDHRALSTVAALVVVEWEDWKNRTRSCLKTMQLTGVSVEHWQFEETTVAISKLLWVMDRRSVDRRGINVSSVFVQLLTWLQVSRTTDWRGTGHTDALGLAEAENHYMS